MNKTTHIQIRATEGLKKRLKNQSKKENRSVSNLITTVMEKYLEENNLIEKKEK